jgi:hypothetical protein
VKLTYRHVVKLDEDNPIVPIGFLLNMILSYDLDMQNDLVQLISKLANGGFKDQLELAINKSLPRKIL